MAGISRSGLKHPHTAKEKHMAELLKTRCSQGKLIITDTHIIVELGRIKQSSRHHSRQEAVPRTEEHGATCATSRGLLQRPHEVYALLTTHLQVSCCLTGECSPSGFEHCKQKKNTHEVSRGCSVCCG